jgi:UDP-N-acetylmuramate--alanine ligase
VARGELLAELLPFRRSIAVAGTHGKTTTAAMIVHALRRAGTAVDYAIGGDLLDTRTNAEWDQGTWLVVETDESDGSLLRLAPDIAVLTNAELDHVERFHSVTEVEAEFAAFLGQANEAVVWDRPSLVALRDGGVSTFDAVAPDLSPGGSVFSWHGRSIRLPVPGAHNARNAAAALETCVLAGITADEAATALDDFPGVARRCQWVGTTRAGAQVIDDYAHHPTEVAAALSAVRSYRPERLVAVIRPWGQARTRAMAAEYGQALADADEVILLDVAGAAGAGRQGRSVTSAVLVDAARTVCPGRPVHWIPEPHDAVTFLHDRLGQGTLVLTLGCGDVAGALVVTPASGRLLPDAMGAVG